MSVIGFDIGNESCVIAAAKRGGVDVLLNNESKRETPAVVSFGEKQRFLGSAGAAFATSNPKSTIFQIKRLIGKLYKEVEEDLKLLPFTTSEGPRGEIVIEIEYLNEKRSFLPVEILAMLFKHLKQLTEKNLETNVVDCVIGIPSYFTDLQRRLYLDAANLAGLKPLRLIHDGTAIALGYGMYKTDFSESGQTIVMFVDIGHCDTQVTLAAFEQGRMKILSHSSDPNLGGRDFDEVLFNHFAAQFKEKFKINVNSNVRASARLRASCEKVKKVLSANAEAPLSIECLIGDTDVRGVITRDEFEKLSSKLLDRVMEPCGMALKDSRLTVDKIHTIELVGSGSRIPAITKYLSSFFEKEPTRTLNASECVARGCALSCAMLSPSLIVRYYKVEDSFPYSIVIPTQRGEIMLFPKGSLFPNDNTLNHSRRIPFYFKVAYRKESDFPIGASDIVGHFGIGSDELSNPEKVKVEFKMTLSNNGIVELDSATIVEDKQHYGFNAFFYVLNPLPNTHKLNLPISENQDVSITKDELNEAKMKEEMLAEQDMKVEKTKDQRNTLESFVYDTRSKLSSSYKSFVTDIEKKEITKSLQETEDWLYDDSDDESEQQYTGRLEDLKKLVEPVENKYLKDAIAKAKKALEDCIAKCRSRADSLRADHKAKVKDVCTKAEQWLVNAFSKKHPSLKTLLSDINNATKLVESDCESVIRSKSIYSWLEIPVVSHPKDQPVDSENATQVTKEAKALEACIVKYRSRAETLPADMKAKFNNLFRKVEEHFLRVVSQKRLSPKALENEINSITNNVESECEKIIRHMNSEVANKRKATKDFKTHIANWRSRAQSLSADIKQKVLTECSRAEIWLNRSSVTAKTQSITEFLEEFKSNCERIITPNPLFTRHHDESNQRDETMDSEYVRTQATKDLQKSITDYRSHAGSLSADQKDKVLIECNNAEVWLMQSSPYASTTQISKFTANFVSNCDSAITSNPSYTRHETFNQMNETMDSEHVKTNAIKSFQDCIGEYRLHAMTLASDKKDMVLNECNRAELWLHQSFSTATTANIDGFKEYFKSICDNIIGSTSSLPMHENSNQRNFENALTEAINAFKTCIAQIRSQAEPLTAEKKEKVLVECNGAEKWLTGLTQKPLSPNDITQIYDITKHLDSFCGNIINSNPSFPWHEENKESDMETDQGETTDINQVD